MCHATTTHDDASKINSYNCCKLFLKRSCVKYIYDYFYLFYYYYFLCRIRSIQLWLSATWIPFSLPIYFLMRFYFPLPLPGCRRYKSRKTSTLTLLVNVRSCGSHWAAAHVIFHRHIDIEAALVGRTRTSPPYWRGQDWPADTQFNVRVSVFWIQSTVTLTID